MTINLDQTTVKKFESDVKFAFQQKGMLRQAVRVKDAKGAKQVEFRVYGKGLAKKRNNVQTPLEVMNIALATATATVENWYASELTDIFLQNQVDFDERQLLVQTVKDALERRIDQLILDVLAAGTPTATPVSVDAGGVATNLNTTKLRGIMKSLSALSVPDEGRSLICHVNNVAALLGETKATSSDYNSLQALVKGDINSYMGLNFIKLGDRAEGGLATGAGNTRKIYAVEKNSVGLAMNMEPRVTIDWDPTFGAHRVTGYVSAGAVIIDADGFNYATCDEDDLG